VNYSDYFYSVYNSVQHPDFLWVPVEEPGDVDELIEELLREVSHAKEKDVSTS